MKKNDVFLIIFLILIFSVGYYLRAYLTIEKDLAYSPYEAFRSENNYQFFNQNESVKDFTDKEYRYPLSVLLADRLNQILGNFYVIYILGAIVLFFLGRELSGKTLGGVLAFSVYAVSSENLIQYTRIIDNSSLSYIFMWAGLLFFYLYLKSKKAYWIILFMLFSLITIVSYHTGALAMIFIVVGILISIICSNFKKDKVIFASLFTIIGFYLIWILLFDKAQITSIIYIIRELNYLKISIFLIILIFISLSFLFINKLRELNIVYFCSGAIIMSLLLVFFKLHFFDFLLRLGVKNYYISTITLNNYIAQFLLLHIYLLILLPYIFRKEINKREIILRGWFIGIILFSFGLVITKYYSRIFDYTFPLIFVLFGVYWSKNEKLRKIIVSITLLILICSQLIIYNDPFTMRRYYNQDEIDSANNIIKLNLTGYIVSDLRIASLFSYLGKKDIIFEESGDKHYDYVFYDYKSIKDLGIDYVIISKNMEHVLYSTNFQTKPVNDSFFEYYQNNFKEVYNDGLMMVYKIK